MNRERGGSDIITFENEDQKREYAGYLKLMLIQQILLNNYPHYHEEQVHSTEEERLLDDLGALVKVEAMEAYCSKNKLEYLTTNQLHEAIQEALKMYNENHVQGFADIDDSKEN